MRQIILAVFGFTFFAVVAFAGSGGGGVTNLDSNSTSSNVSDAVTQRIVNRLNTARAQCGSLGAAYRADCTAQAYEEAAKEAKGSGYTRARGELNKTARKLSRLVSKNVDSDAEPVQRGGKTYHAVKKTAVKKVAQQAVKIIAETETKLLRSSGSGERKVHYQRIAQAVGSTKKIFRS